jgi:enoyl-CoA hydratase
MTAAITTRNEGDIAVITMDDGKANALSHDFIASLNDAFDEAVEADAVILAGRPGRFSAGFDLKIMTSGKEAVNELLRAGARLFTRIYGFERPVVTAVSGHAIAGGLILAGVGDHRIGIAGDFKLGLNEVANGMPVPIMIHRFARELLTPGEFVSSVLHSRMYDPEAAARAGWIDTVVDPEELFLSAMSAAKQLGQLQSVPYMHTKRSIRGPAIDAIMNTLEADLAELPEFSM